MYQGNVFYRLELKSKLLTLRLHFHLNKIIDRCIASLLFEQTGEARSDKIILTARGPAGEIFSFDILLHFIKMALHQPHQIIVKDIAISVVASVYK